MENSNINLEELLSTNNKILRKMSELTWSTIFHDAICNSEWLIEKDFCPGRWAVGYPYLYVLYRILNESHPSSILDLGLGQTSKMISQYALHFSNTKHIIVESDKNWIDFAKKSFKIKDCSKIVCLDYIMGTYKEQEVRIYKNFENTFSNKKFNLISIDAPYGGDMKSYSRIDILKLLPGCLSESFIIMLDDYDRIPEKNTISEMITQLKNSNIEFYTHIYSGEKTCYIITSSDNKWFCSL